MVNQFEIWIADFNPQLGTEGDKKRPVLVMQTNLLNAIPHATTVICPLTDIVKEDFDILRVHLKSGMANLTQDFDVMIDQIRALDNKRLIEKVGKLPEDMIQKVKENITILLDLE
ncbi:type II toxin-antitoxin system PemK/MazF family toxin [Flavobacterium antarcticum]|uniref:type II toxin-antitoxin system PemK/MazF family toxin n=1 Tax=Flavobacterium antarcticum TaxID=271155 RepID=UPI0003B5CF9B|nr:type II toxin-antitoxin system PemK/MazF family toxin [Flavobacterium antarcticum]